MKEIPHFYYEENNLHAFLIEGIKDFDILYPDMVARIKSDEYYICMMKACYFATALAKHYEVILPFLVERKLDKTIHNMTVKKAIESFRISPEQKKYLKTLKI